MKHGRAAIAALLAGVVVVATAAAGDPTTPTRPEHPLPAFNAPALDARYAAIRRAIEHAARAERDPATARRLSALTAPGRRFLTFDRRRRAVEVLGDLASAVHVTILVPGADTTPAVFDARGAASPGGGARALMAEARRIDPERARRLAVIAWLGYDAPHTLSLDVAGTGRADQGARNLRPLIDRLAVRGTRVTLLCHSYGTVVCGRTRDPNVSEIAVFGSPGTTVPSADRLPARVWAGRATGDWTRYVPKVRIAGLGFGADPASKGFGAHRFAAGSGGHGDYLRPGGVSLHNLALIALGRTSEVIS